MRKRNAQTFVRIMAEHELYRTLAIHSPGQDLQLQTRDLNALSHLPPTGVLVRVHASGVCHTDLHLWQGFFQLGKGKKIKFAEREGFGYPVVPGHEIAGVVAALGARVKDKSALNVGDRVAVYPWVGCEQCGVCEGGDPHLCSGETKQLGFNVDGGYSEYVALPHHKFVIKVPETVTDEVAAMLPCSALTVFSAIKRCTPVIERVRRWQMETFVVVVGLGGLGQWAVNLLRHTHITGSPTKVVGIDISSEKLDLVAKNNLINSTFLYDPSKPASQLAAEFLSKFGGQKPHIVLDFVNSTETFNFGRKLLHKGGCLVPVGLHGGEGEVPLPEIVISAYTIAGSHVGSLSELQELMEVVREHSITPPPISTYPLEKGGQALQDLQDGRILGRAVLKMD